MKHNLLFFSAILVAGLGCLFVAFTVRKKNFLLSPVLLLIGSLPIGFCAMEWGTWFVTILSSSNDGNPKAPSILSRYQAPSFVRIKNSILYLAPPNSTFRTFGNEFKTNGLGFRERHFNLKKPEKTFRILVFGDSITFGVGVADEQRYTNLLETKLNLTYQKRENRVDHRVEVLNFGVPGFSLDQERDLMRSILKIIECDLVILGIIEDDLKMTTRYALRGFTLNKGQDSVSISIYKNPERTFETISKNEPEIFARPARFYDGFFIFDIVKERTNWFAWRALPNLKRWSYALNEFKKIQSLTQQYRLPPPVVTLLHYGGINPNANDFKNPVGKIAENIELMQFIGSELASRGVIVVDTLPQFKKYNRMVLAVSEWEWHPNYLAHYIYAQSILNVLLGHNLLP